MEMNRRNFLMGSALFSAAAVAGLTGCAPKTTQESDSGAEAGQAMAATGNVPEGAFAVDFEQSVVELEPITDFAAEETYDIVVVGAGCAGVPAVMTALEEGATVACLQKEPTVAANGSSSTGVAKGLSTAAGIARWKWDWARENGWRLNPTLMDFWIDHSEETISWIAQKAIEAGTEASKYDPGHNTVCYEDGETVVAFSVKMPSNNEVMTAIAAMAEQQGAVFYYSTPAVQLVMDGDAVTGVIGKTDDGNYIKLNATKGVILAAGDYMNNDALVKRYCEDIATADYDRRQLNRTGDGHLLAVTAGSRIVPAGHAKQVHDLGVTASTMMACPFLMLDENGNRFFNEECSMTMWNIPLKYRYPNQTPLMFRFFDSAYAEKYAMCGDTAPQELLDGKVLGPEDYGKKGIYRADTLEELFEILGVDAAAFQSSIDRYNELCAKGVDEDFGKDSQYMTPIDTPPFYGLRYSPGLAAINGGVLVDGNYQVVNANREPIPGLYAAGVDAGDLCGGTDWIMPGGCSNGHCFTAGRYTVIHALTGGHEPKNPCSFEDIADKFLEKDGGFIWDTPEKCFREIQVW